MAPYQKFIKKFETTPKFVLNSLPQLKHTTLIQICPYDISKTQNPSHKKTIPNKVLPQKHF